MSIRKVQNALSQNGYGYIYIYIRRPLQSVERVRLHLLAYKPTSRSKGPEEDISPASQGGQAAEIEGSSPPGIQAAGVQDVGGRMLKSKDPVIFSSFKGPTGLIHQLNETSGLIQQLTETSGLV